MKKKIIVIIMFIVGLGSGQMALADTSQAEAIRKGQEHFKIFCSNCHGMNADGRGTLASQLDISPSDLTALQQTGGEVCLAERVLKAVAGVHDMAAGQAQMPTFSGNLESITVYEITQYLKSIQQ